MNLNSTLSPVAVPLTMSSREIADLTGKELGHVNRDIRAMLDGLPDDPELEHVREDQDGRGYTTAFHLGRELTYTLLAGYSVVLRRRVIARWQELEAQQAPSLPNFSDPVAAARAWADVKESEQKAAAELALAAPKVNFFDKVVERNTLMTATQIAQKLGMSAIKLNKYLDELGIYAMGVKRARVFKQWVIDKRYGELKQTELGYSQPLFTTAGEAWIVERLTSEGVA
ncbi:MAG: phage antirepressor KilAC domain-containing protein [Citrobacter sp.]